MVNIKRSITFGRHGESEQNIIKPEKVKLDESQLQLFRERDTGDHRLTNRGRNEGQAMGAILKQLNMGFNLLVTSSFTRAMETLLETGLSGQIEISPLLDERFTGELENLLKSEAKKLYPNAGRDRRRKETRWRPQNGESMRDVQTRTLVFMEQLKSLPGGNGHVFITTHSRVIASYMQWAEQLENHQVPGAAGAEGEGVEIANGQIIQYGWTGESLRPTHKRSFVPGGDIDLEWKQLPRDARFTVEDIRRMVESYPRILT